MNKVSLLSLLIGLFLLTTASSAHQPRIVSEELTQIENPEVSQAFYAELKGKPGYYQIESEEPFKLYVGILVPDLEGIDKDISVEISREDLHIEETRVHKQEEEEVPILLNGLEYEWIRLYEPFAGDWYWEGPELRSNSPDEELPDGVKVDEGTYTLKVFSPDNEGKYVLVVGEREEFPLKEMVQTLFVLPKLKAQFFERSDWTAYIIGCIAGVVPWIVIAIYFGGSIIAAKGGMPNFVIGIFISLAVFFNLFAVNMLLQYNMKRLIYFRLSVEV